jgi:1-acyl-sn-glycerol-3-phosphate acyltransferase
MQKGYFDTFIYDSEEKKSLNFREWLFQDNWFYFLLKFALIVLRSQRKVINHEYDTKEWTDSSFEVFRLIEKTGGKFHISGMENIIKSTEPVVFISNHMSTLETMVFPCLIAPRREVTFVVKESLVRHPLFSHVMRSRDPIVVRRTDARKDFEVVMAKGPELLKNGVSIIVFPQSTRSTKFIPEEFNSLGVKLAKKAGVKVVPVALKTDFWGNGKIIKEIGPLDHLKPVFIKFAEPFSVSGRGKNENQRIIDFIQLNLNNWTAR